MKELVIEVTSELSDNATIEEIFDAILVRSSIMKGLEDVENGNLISNEDLLKEIQKMVIKWTN